MLVIAASLLWLHAVSPAAPPAVDRAPERLVSMRPAAVAVFDAARTGNWSAADERLQTLDEMAESLPRRLPSRSAARRMRTRLNALKHDVRDHRTIAAMQHANEVARAVGELEDEYGDTVPAAVRLLSYYGRQLEIASAAKRPQMVRRAVGGLHTAWRDVEPMLLRRGSTDEARRFTDVLVELDAVRSPANAARPAAEELSEADRVQQLFATQ